MRKELEEKEALLTLQVLFFKLINYKKESPDTFLVSWILNSWKQQM